MPKCGESISLYFSYVLCEAIIILYYQCLNVAKVFLISLSIVLVLAVYYFVLGVIRDPSLSPFPGDQVLNQQVLLLIARVDVTASTIYSFAVYPTLGTPLTQ